MGHSKKAVKVTILYWTALYLVAHKATFDLDTFQKGSLRRDILVFLTIGIVATLLTLLLTI